MMQSIVKIDNKSTIRETGKRELPSKIHFIRKSQSSGSGFCLVSNRVCDAVVLLTIGIISLT